MQDQRCETGAWVWGPGAMNHGSFQWANCVYQHHAIWSWHICHLGVGSYPEGTNVFWPLNQNNTTVKKCGNDILAPLPSTSAQLHSSSTVKAPHSIHLVDGSIIHALSAFMDLIVDCQSPFQESMNGAYTESNVFMGQPMHQRLHAHQFWDEGMEFLPSALQWHGTLGMVLPELIWGTQQIINDGALIPGWHTSTKFIQALLIMPLPSIVISPVLALFSIPWSLTIKTEPCGFNLTKKNTLVSLPEYIWYHPWHWIPQYLGLHW